jgi:hypothetical protein
MAGLLLFIFADGMCGCVKIIFIYYDERTLIFVFTEGKCVCVKVISILYDDRLKLCVY